MFPKDEYENEKYEEIAGEELYNKFKNDNPEMSEEQLDKMVIECLGNSYEYVYDLLGWERE